MNTNHLPTCPICLENIQNDNICVLVPCGHSFCIGCITKWTTKKLICPMCMSEPLSFTKSYSLEECPFNTISEKSSPSFEELEENFECFDHNYFLEEYAMIMKKLEELEFEFRSLIRNKRFNNKLKENQVSIMYIKDETKTTIANLKKGGPIVPVEILKDLQSTDQLIKKMFKDVRNCTSDINNQTFLYDEREEDIDLASKIVYTDPKKKNKKGKKK